MASVLIADDDHNLLKMLSRTLTYGGMDVITAGDGHEALELAYAQHPDVIVLDWMMPGQNGLRVLEMLREDHSETPVLMLTARDAIEDRVRGLESGADDYLVKPFAPAELVARVHALLRRVNGGEPERLSFADLRLDLETREGWRGERRFSLTPTEYELLRLLMRHPRQVMTRGQILTQVWGYDFGGDENVIDVYISYVRRKTEEGDEPRLVHTIRGIGYVLREHP